MGKELSCAKTAKNTQEYLTRIRIKDISEKTKKFIKKGQDLALKTKKLSIFN